MVINVQRSGSVNLARINPFDVIYITGFDGDDGAARLVKESGDVVVLEEFANDVWNPGTLRLSSDTLDLGHGVSISGVGDHVRYSTADQTKKFLVIGTPFDDDGTGTPETIVLGTRVNEDPFQSVFDTELTAATEHTFAITFSSGIFIYQLHFFVGSIGAADAVKLTVSEGLVDGGSIHFQRNYNAATFPTDGHVDLDMLAGIAFDSGDEAFFKIESDTAFNFLGNSSGDLYLAFDQQPESDEDLISTPTGTDRFLADSNGDLITDNSGNLVLSA